MYKEVLRAIVGIEVFPVLSLLIFLTVFVVMLVRVFRMDRTSLATCARLPLQDEGPAPADTRQHHDALGGAQL